MNLLAIDSAGSILSVAVCSGEKIEYEELDAGFKQTEAIMDLITKQMEKASLLPKDLNGVLCMAGPGSFTGLRLGYSIAKGLSLALDIPFAPVPTLDCIALYGRTVFSECDLTLALIQAVKGSFFYAFFGGTNRLTADKEASFSELNAILSQNDYKNKKIAIVGSNSHLFSDTGHKTVPVNCGYAKEIITIAKSQDIFHNVDSAPLYSGPEYIRKTDAEINLLGRTG